MSYAAAQKINRLSQSKDFKADVKTEIGDLSNAEVYFNQILVATYIRPEKIGNIIRPQTNVGEDEYQGKVGIVLKKGPMAFKNMDGDESTFAGLDVELDDYVVYRAGDGWAITINGVACRMLLDRNIRMRIKDPEMVF